jgi:hypothetical protein
MSHWHQSPSLFYISALISLLVIITRFQSCTSQCTESWRDDAKNSCKKRNRYYDEYGCVNPGLKVIDALQAQNVFISNSPTVRKYNYYDVCM